MLNNLGENQIPIMPMLHILSTHGFVLSFDLLNFQPMAIGICSPPQSIADQSGLQLFRQDVAIVEFARESNIGKEEKPSKEDAESSSKTETKKDFRVGITGLDKNTNADHIISILKS